MSMNMPSRNLTAIRSTAQSMPNTRFAISGEDGKTDIFTFDEEPLVIGPEKGCGYYPMTIGQIIDEPECMLGKMEIVRKLGWAAYSTVWLARICDEASPTRYVAVKILNVNATAGVLNGWLAEEDSFKVVTSADPNHPGYQHCLHLREAFISDSHWGPHLCFATDILGMDMMALRRSQPNKVFSVSATKRIIKQTLLALDYLHRKCELVHTDVKAANTLVSLKLQDDAVSRLLAESPSETYKPRIFPGLTPNPFITVKSQPLPNFGLDPDLKNLHVCLVDYGHATPTTKRLSEGAQPILLRAPEVILGYPWSTGIDIWSVGCIVFEYLIGPAFFQLHDTPEALLEESMLRRMVEHLGPFPESFLAACRRRPDFFDKKGSFLRPGPLFPQTVEDCIRIYNRLDEKDIASVANFMRRCLVLDPAMRPSAQDLLNDDWLKDA